MEPQADRGTKGSGAERSVVDENYSDKRWDELNGRTQCHGNSNQV